MPEASCLYYEISTLGRNLTQLAARKNSVCGFHLAWPGHILGRYYLDILSGVSVRPFRDGIGLSRSFPSSRVS
jgi:hypothetical protein